MTRAARLLLVLLLPASVACNFARGDTERREAELLYGALRDLRADYARATAEEIAAVDLFSRDGAGARQRLSAARDRYRVLHDRLGSLQLASPSCRAALQLVLGHLKEREGMLQNLFTGGRLREWRPPHDVPAATMERLREKWLLRSHGTT
jgi:hypothetical protein